MQLTEAAETEIPVIMLEDNESAIFLAANKQVSQHKKHMTDLRYHFIRWFTKKDSKGISKGILAKMRTKEKNAYRMTKNADTKIYEYLGG